MPTTSVYRQVVDLSDPASATWVIPGGASGVPGSKHHHDQLAAWGRGDRIPMLYRQEAVEAGAASSTLLVPAGAIELTGSGR